MTHTVNMTHTAHIVLISLKVIRLIYAHNWNMDRVPLLSWMVFFYYHFLVFTTVKQLRCNVYENNGAAGVSVCVGESQSIYTSSCINILKY